MDDTKWALVAVERRSLADCLASLDEDQWETSSLCSEWRVRDVAAHLVMTPAREPGVGAMARALLHARGDLWGAGCDVAIAYAEKQTPAGLVAELRARADSRAKPVFVIAENILIDLVVHGQDICRPLGIDRPIPGRAALLSLQRFWAMGWPFWAARRLRGVRLHCSDVDWSAGEGPELRGSAAALLLLMTGRTEAAIPLLDGPGVKRLQSA